MAFLGVLFVILIPCIWVQYDAWKRERAEEKGQATAERVKTHIIAAGPGFPGDIPPKK